MTPEAMQTHLKTLDLAHRYSFDIPKVENPIVLVSNHAQVAAAVKSENFSSFYSERAKTLGLGKG
jgi:hypothetical protein